MAQPLWLRIEGARQNNLKNVTVAIPHDQITVVTGVSGSGKSSLAFDTIFAEGQWRYIESLSTYARMFLEKLDRPDVDRIEHIRPAIAIEQTKPVRPAHSTVGTTTEIADLLRLLFAKTGHPVCPDCGTEARSYQPGDVTETLLTEHPGARAMILFPVAIGEAVDPHSLMQDLLHRGFVRLRIADDIVDLTPDVVRALASRLKGAAEMEVVVDRIVRLR